MTSYTQNDYYFNEIDALSCNNRPISSTLRSKSTYNAYESQTEDETTSYDLYGNQQEYNDGSSCDSYNHHQRSTSTMSNAGNYNVSYCSNDYNQYCKNVITTDNLMYHRDACSGDSSDRYDIYSVLDYGDYDNHRAESINYGTTGGVDADLRPFTALGDSSNNKILPQVPPVQQSDSMWDGMYSSGQHRQSNVSLPSTPTFRYNGGSVGGRGVCSNTGDWDRGFIVNGVKAQLNGHRNYDQNSGIGFHGHRPPERTLPLPQSQLKTFTKKSLKQQFFEDNSDNMATTTTSMSAYRNQINLDYKKEMPVTSKTQNLPHYNNYYDNETDFNNSYNTYESRYSIEPRPHTAMQSTDEYNDFGLTSMDNMSTYSDTTVPTATTYANQQKLQDLQKCRYSIIMAMTTASVIASGETRIPQHLLKKTPKTTSTEIGEVNSLSGAGIMPSSTVPYMYDNNSDIMGSNNKNGSINWSNSLTSCAYTNVANHSSVNLHPVTLSTAASSSMLLLSSASPIVADSANSSKSNNSNTTAATAATGSTTETRSGLSMLKNLTSRKLPKHHTGRGLVTNKLPQSPQYPLSHAVPSKTLPETPHTSSLKTTDTLDNINLTSSISLAATSSTFSLSYQDTFLASSSFITAAKTTDQTSAIAGEASSSSTTTTTITSSSSGYMLPNNNNNTTDFKNYDNFNNYKNNNFFNNNVQNTDNKYAVEQFRIKLEEGNENSAESDKDNEEPPIYHLSTTPSRLNSLTIINDSLSEPPPSHQLKKETAHDMLLSSKPSSNVDETKLNDDVSTTTTKAITTNVLSLAKTTSSITTSESGSLFDSDYKTSYDYADYLKPYTLPTFHSKSTSETSSNNTNIQFTLTQSSISSNISNSYLPYPSVDIHTDYLALSSTKATDTTSSSTTLTSFSTMASTSSTSTTTSSSTTTTAAEATTILAINNRGLNNITALNLSDNNISRKSSISSPITKIASPSGSVVPISSISYYTTTDTKTLTTSITTLSPSSNVQTSIASSSSNTTLTTYSDHTTSTLGPKKDESELESIKSDTNLFGMTEVKATSSSLYLDNYDQYLKDYKLDFISTSTISPPLPTSTERTPVTTSTTTSSSLLNNSCPTSTMLSYTTATTKEAETNDNRNSYTINNNEAESASLLAFTPNCLFTTTETTTQPSVADGGESQQTLTKDSLTTTAAKASTYADYLKDFGAVTASSSTSFATTEITRKASQELPAYIMDFLLTSNSTDYDGQSYLNLYKIDEGDTEKYKTSDICDVKTSANNNNIPSNDIPATKNDLAIIASAVTTSAEAIKEETSSASLPSVTSLITSASDTTNSSTSIAASTEYQLTTTTALTMVDFDDNFYSSFSVNLNSLIDDTATTTVISTSTTTPVTKYGATEDIKTSVETSETTIPSYMSSTTSSFIDTLIPSVYINSDNTSKSLFNISSTLVGTSTEATDVTGNLYTTSTMATTKTTTATSIMQQSLVTSTTSSSNQKASGAGIKAASMLGGLSQSIKGGLDGVLAAAGSNEPQQQKRGFGFGLASKFVPNVGGLLSSTPKSTASSSTTTQPTKITPSEPITTQRPPQATIASYSNEIDYNYDETSTTTAFTTSADYMTMSMNDAYYDDVASSGIITTSNNNNMDFVVSTDIYDNEEHGVNGGLYYNSSQTTFYHITSSLDYAQDEMMTNHSEQMVMYDDVVTRDINDASSEYFADENQVINGYGGYSEYESVTTAGNFIDTSIAYSTSSAAVPAVTSGIPPIATSSMQSNNSSTVTAAKKATSSLFSSLTNVASQISQQTSSTPAATTAAVTTCSSTANATSAKQSGGGMFGSIFGKAAAAMQTATQVVNQGASLASSKVQKNLQQPTSTAPLVKRVSITEEPITCVASTVAVTEQNYQRSTSMSHQNSLPSPYASSLGGSGDDYDNSNIPISDGDIDQHHLVEEEYYYANQNQQLIHQQSQQKLLPTVPPAGASTGKKLPTINDKSVCLVKQQPTEIYEGESEVHDNKSLPYLKRVPTYDIDSEQADYYMDTPQAALSTGHISTDGYYEHTNGGSYDYRDDYFNEEDEFKYLEKEKIEAKEDLLYSNKQQQHQLRQIHKQSSLQYGVDDGYQQNEVMDEYMDDMYHSEDSGNYLDESSSGSVKALATHQQPPTTTTSLEDSLHHHKTSTLTSTTTTSAPSHQIKKQDSIILEENERDDTVESPLKSLSRKSSHGILDVDEDDQMGDLQMVSASLRSSQSRKMKLMRGETEEVVGGHMQIMKRKTEVTAKQRWHWAYNKIIMQLNVST